ncbi:MAG: hypothetical protein IID18_08110, partial [Nitrospinae bacterium]|nr:hypothetical protein [Nitrospinota bacterium]
MTPALSPRTFTLLTRILIYVYCVNAFALPAADTDLWGHLKFGQETWETGSIQKTDHYSYTAQGLPWINHEWLTEVFFYLLFLGFGSAGLLMFKLLAGLFII